MTSRRTHPPRPSSRGFVSAGRRGVPSADGAAVVSAVRRRATGLVLASVLAGLAPALLAGFVAAGSPSPAESVGPAASLPTRDALGQLEVWLDADIVPRDSPAGRTFRAGFTFWDRGQLALGEVHGVYVRLRPSAGAAAPSEGRVLADFPGHVVADLTVPRGGAGRLEVGVHGQACGSNGICAPVDLPLPIAGTGPPPDAPAFELLSASIDDVVGVPGVARPFPVTAEVVPRGLWDARAVAMPDMVDVVAFLGNDPSGATYGRGSLERDGNVGGSYAGTITVRAAGPVELSVVLHGGGAVIELAGQRTVVDVVEAGGGPSLGPPAASRGADAPGTPIGAQVADPGVPPLAWILLVGALVVGGGALLLRSLADQ